LKIANVEMETDPALAFKDFRTALQRTDALAQADQNSLATVRLRTMLLRKEGNCMVALGEYPEALPLFAEAEKLHRRLVAEDPKDSRALADLQVLLNDEALDFEAAANPALALAGEKMLKDDPSNQNLRSILADAQVRLGTIQSILHTPGDHDALAKEGLAALRDMAKKEGASPMTLDNAANAFLKVEPASLRDPGLAISFAERQVAQSHGRRPSLLLTLAQAYRASGQLEKGRVTAFVGLALLPATPPGSVKPNSRKLLEIQTQRSR
jgi:tetratricopeptide (TPR) repeat protein